MSSKQEHLLSWSGAAISAVYLCWCGFVLRRGAIGLGAFLTSMQASVPVPTKFVVTHSTWLAVSFSTAGALILLKEFLVRDKRFSLMLTMLAVIVVRALADVVLRLFYLPLTDLIANITY